MDSGTAIVQHQQQQPTTFSYGLIRPGVLEKLPIQLSPDEEIYYRLELEYLISEYEKQNLSYGKLKGQELARYHIGLALESFYEMLGLKKENYPSKPLAKAIAKYIQQTFHYITPSEIVQAVVFAMQEKFKIPHDHPLDHYQVMDLKFINRILQAYVKFRYSVKYSLNEKIEAIKSETPKAELIELLLKEDKAVKDIITEMFTRYKADPTERLPWFREEWFSWLSDSGFIKRESDQMNQTYKEIVHSHHHKIGAQARAEVVLIFVYKWFESIQSDPNALSFLNTLTYLSPSYHQKLQHAKS